MGSTGLCALALLSTPAAAQEPLPDRPPNVVLILTDDQGYGDLACYGAEDLSTPHLDRLAAEGVRFTDFHVAQAVCSASRAALLTGCYSERVGIRGALGPADRHGLHPDEETLAELLGEHGYATGAFGKWHLGHHEPFLPLAQGFDEYLGLPYSNDMWPVDEEGRPESGSGYPPLHLMEGNRRVRAVQTLEDQARLTETVTARALDFIERHHGEPFFLYLAHPMPHVPLGAPLRLAGTSDRGAYGDVIAEIDASTGRVLGALERHGLTDDTLVIFSSDNGPWLCYGDHAGSTGGLREGKQTVFEGGTRVPLIVRLPGHTARGAVCDGLVASMDILPTVAELCGARSPARTIDGVSVAGLLARPADPSPRRTLLHYHGGHLNGVRRGSWKLVLPHGHVTYEGVERGRGGLRGPHRTARAELSLHDLAADPTESVDVAAEHPDVVAALQRIAAEARVELGDRHRGLVGRGARPVGRLPARRPAPGVHLATDAAVRLDRAPDPRYSAGGGPALVDGRVGSEDFADGAWLGWRGGAVEVVLDLGEPARVERLTASFLRVPAAWIFLPRAVELAVSEDGDRYEVVGRFTHEPSLEPRVESRDLSVGFAPRTARFLRLRADSVGACPEGHAGAGEDGWLFLDELVAR